MARVIGIFSGKGGSGKTTTAVNLGALLAKRGKAVTLVDCNLTTSHLGLHLGMYNYHVSLNHVLRDEYDVSDAVYSHPSGMKIVPAAVALTDIRNVDPDKLGQVVKKIEPNNDFILLDASPGLGREAYSALKASQDVLYVSNPQLPSVIDVLRCQSAVSETGANPLGVVLNMVTKDKHEMRQKEVEYLTELPVISSIPYDKHVRRSLALKTPVVTLKPNSAASKEFRRLAARLVEGDTSPAMEDISFAQFLKRKFSRR